MQIIVQDIISIIEEFAPLQYQESYDNAGLIIGNHKQQVTSALLCIDVTEGVVDEAIALGSNVIIAHHPLIFTGIKKINGKNEIERCIIKAIQNNIAIYAAHTNIDAVAEGVNAKICNKIGLSNCKILHPISNDFVKLVTYIPIDSADKVREALFLAGAGNIGKYDSCSFSSQGVGTFRAGQGTQPFVGDIGYMHSEYEVRFETIFPKHLTSKVISALTHSHPYEEVAYDIIPLTNKNSLVGAGMIGELPNALSVDEFLLSIKKTFNSKIIRFSSSHSTTVKKVAVCGGAGSFLISDALHAKADIFLTGDVKYHDFFNADNKMIIADIGHYESEQYTKEIFYEIINKKFPKFALHFSKVITNPINYL